MIEIHPRKKFQHKTSGSNIALFELIQLFLWLEGKQKIQA